MIRVILQTNLCTIRFPDVNDWASFINGNMIIKPVNIIIIALFAEKLRKLSLFVKITLFIYFLVNFYSITHSECSFMMILREFTSFMEDVFLHEGMLEMSNQPILLRVCRKIPGSRVFTKEIIRIKFLKV